MGRLVCWQILLGQGPERDDVGTRDRGVGVAGVDDGAWAVQFVDADQVHSRGDCRSRRVGQVGEEQPCGSLEVATPASLSRIVVVLR